MLSSFLDGSVVYGSEVPLANKPRHQTSQLGLLAVNWNFTDSGKAYMPFYSMQKDPCLKAKIPCFLAGKLRAGTPNPEIQSEQFHQPWFVSLIVCFSYLSRK